MTRKVFLADVTSASEKVIPNIIDVKRGDDDGDVNFIFVPTSGAPIAIGLLALDVSGYPNENNFMIFTKSSDIPPGVNETLEDVGNFSAGMRIAELVQNISQRLTKHLATGTQADPVNIDEDSDVEMLDEAGEAEEESEEEYDPGFDSGDDADFGYGSSNTKTSTSMYRLSPDATSKLTRRIKEDLRAVRLAGFKIGILSGMNAEAHTSLLSISIQAAKLGLSEEALQAWDLEPHQYIVLLLRYSSGYKTFEGVIAEPAKALDIAFRIGVCDKYKPSVPEALAAFTELTKDTNDAGQPEDSSGKSIKPSGFSSIFISSSLNDFINDQFISLLKIRTSAGIGWDGAKHYYNDRQGRWTEKDVGLPEHYYKESTPKQSSLAEMMYADHLTEDGKDISFPLIAAQFAMRYLLRCTEFCLVCHDRIEGDFEALKPYVCDKPLCLYQYMSLGFGPSVEHEIITQPYVVDLLVSFCYTAAYCRRIREYPTGMSLSVPPVMSSVTQAQPGRILNHRVSGASVPQPVVTPPTINTTELRYDSGRQEIVFELGASCPVRNGDWVVITPNGPSMLASIHYRVADISLFPTVKLCENGVTPGALQLAPANQPVTPATPATTPPPPALIPARMTVYDQNFDDMDDVNKAETIIMLLETLPSISRLRRYLIDQTSISAPSLRAWKERVSPAALGLLRWIIASNRSCIVQVDRCPGQEDVDASEAKIRLDQKCGNVPDNWLQFRFAQGSPDKEQRFLNALKAEEGNLQVKYPTMFAFHGSALQNWHSIIRHGLDFKETINGRAYGHGVYHAMDQNISVSYAQHSAGSWPASDLKINTAMSLNEIVNCPAQFTSSSPYIVVQHIDWIQARYLFCQITNGRDYTSVAKSEDPSPSALVEQDPNFIAKSQSGKPIGVPLCAVSVSRAFRANTEAMKPTTNKRMKRSGSAGNTSTHELVVSDDEELDDINFLFHDDEEVPTINGKGKAAETEPAQKSSFSLKSLMPSFSKPKTKIPAKPTTDFVPGTLDQATLPILDEPSYATPSATMRLNRDLKELLKIQNSTPLHELGWYLNSDLVNNMYQWIIELHSFDAELPLAQDMKAAGMNSIVLEMRFPKDYPHSPPFIRVIRPRFLPFTQGGGGHVTGGGAMCMELLTNSGWSSVSSIEGVLLQVRMAIMNLEPKPARLETRSKGSQRDYGTGEAMQAYIRACQTHGWQIPKDFQDFAGGSVRF